MGFFGVIIESLELTFRLRKPIYKGGYILNFPSKPIYATGGLLLFFLVKVLAERPWYEIILLSTFAITVWEYIGGIYCLSVLKEKLWDYSDQPFNLNGIISLWSVKWWLIFVTIFYFVIFDPLIFFQEYLVNFLNLSPALDILIIIVSMFIVVFAFIQKAKSVKQKKFSRKGKK